MNRSSNTITKGRILVYRVFDIGEEVDLEKLQKTKESTIEFHREYGIEQNLDINDEDYSLLYTYFLYSFLYVYGDCFPSSRGWQYNL